MILFCFEYDIINCKNIDIRYIMLYYKRNEKSMVLRWYLNDFGKRGI